MNMRSFMRTLQRTLNVSKPSPMDVIGPAIGALAVGLLAGAGIALLLAPQTGNKLREQIEKQLSSAKSRLLPNNNHEPSTTGYRANASTSSLEHRS